MSHFGCHSILCLPPVHSVSWPHPDSHVFKRVTFSALNFSTNVGTMEAAESALVPSCEIGSFVRLLGLETIQHARKFERTGGGAT